MASTTLSESNTSETQVSISKDDESLSISKAQVSITHKAEDDAAAVQK